MSYLFPATPLLLLLSMPDATALMATYSTFVLSFSTEPAVKPFKFRMLETAQ